MSFRYRFYPQSLEHGSPFYKLCLHLGSDLERMVGNPLCSPRFVELSFELNDASIEGEVVGQEPPAFCLKRSNFQGLGRIDSCDVSILAQELSSYYLAAI